MSDQPTPVSPATRWWESPLAKRAIDILIAVAVAYLAAKGIKLPGETPPVPVNVYVGHDAPK